MSPRTQDLRELLVDTIREVLRSWRLPAALGLGVVFGLIERRSGGTSASLVFGPVAALYTLCFGPLPWRALVPLEADGQRIQKAARWTAAASIALGLFALLVVPYLAFVGTLATPTREMFAHPREIVVTTLLFMVGGWGLARDVQLEQRLDRSLRTHGQLAAQLEEARLYALRADLDPHFLFNALNAIASQCVSDPRQAEDNIVRLSSLLRAVLDTRRRPLHPLEDELGLCKDYLGLLGARYPALRWTLKVAGVPQGFPVPPLLLQPLLENAVRHGRIDQGPIVVDVHAEDDGSVVFDVESPGPLGAEREGGMGVQLVERRVAYAWGEGAAFRIVGDARTTHARVTIPGRALAEPVPTPARSPA